MKTQLSERLKELIGDKSISAFARQVGVSESLLRKYLKGAEPSLGKADQIARKSGCSLQWLASGEGPRRKKSEVLDLEVLEKAIRLTQESVSERDPTLQQATSQKLIVANYQYLQGVRFCQGSIDEFEATSFSQYVAELCWQSDR